MNQKQLEKQLRKLYKETAETVKNRIEKRSAGFATAEKAMKEKVASGAMTQRELNAWRRREFTLSQWAKQLYVELEDDIVNASRTASSIINASTVEAYVAGYNVGLYEIEKGIKAKTMFGLYNKTTVERLLLSKPKLLPTAGTSRWGARRLRNAVAQSILKGEGIAKLSKRLQLVTNMEGVSAIKNARTIMTSAQNGGRLKVAEDAEEMGIQLTKVWVATLDERTRESHAEMDGEEVPVDEPFVLINHDGSESNLMYPADPEGDAEQVYNCRCTLAYNVNGALDNINPANIERMSNIPDYDKWKNRR